MSGELTVVRRGIDVSYCQPKIDWAAVAASGIEFAFVRVSHGTKKDTHVERHLDGAMHAGLKVGGYHYLEAGSSAAQVETFLAGVGDRSLDLGVALDIEDPKLDPETTGVVSLAWLDAIEHELYGIDTYIYTCVEAATRLKLAKEPKLAGYALWVAHYTNADHPIVPAPWKTWAVWQHACTGHVPGTRGNVDVNKGVLLW